MARKLRHSALESRSARLKLAVRFKPYSGPTLARGIKLTYRRNKSNGAWVLKASDGHGKYWTKAFAVADDYEDSDGKTVLGFYEAQDAAKRLARGSDAVVSNDAPVSVAGALSRYEDDLKARKGSIYNARMPRKHLTSVLLAKPVALLSATELRKWRDSLIGGALVDASINRMLKCFRAALNLAARHDPRIIQNKAAWTTGLETLPDAEAARNVILKDRQVTALVRAAYAHDAALGLYVDVLAVTGARPSQASRLVVADLVADAKAPRLMMPKSGKGGSKNRLARKAQRFPVPITSVLAASLQAAAKDRPADAALLLQDSGETWGERPSENYRADIRGIVTRLKLDGGVTLYSLRHSSIVRALLLNTPVRVVAASHDTSVVYIEKHYSAHILQHSDELSRRALLHHEP